MRCRLPQNWLGYARDMYAPSAVSMRTFSPSLMNGGTWITRPVSVVAGLVRWRCSGVGLASDRGDRIKLALKGKWSSSSFAREVEKLYDEMNVAFARQVHAGRVRLTRRCTGDG